MRSDLDAPREITTGRCMCEQMETAQSLGDDTHAVATRRSWAREHGLHRVVWSFCVDGWRAWPIDSCSNKDTGKNERKTLTLCGNKTGEARNATREDNKLTETDVQRQTKTNTQADVQDKLIETHTYKHRNRHRHQHIRENTRDQRERDPQKVTRSTETDRCYTWRRLMRGSARPRLPAPQCRPT